jgi:hypothetical protein
LSQYKAILAAADKRFSDDTRRQGGNLRVRFTFDSPDTEPRPQVFLLLKPDGNNGDKKTLLLNSADSGREFGPIPPGEYAARLVAAAFRAEPMIVPLSIESGTTSEIGFVLKPQGMFCGTVNKVPKPGENPAGAHSNPDSEISVESIVLEGGGIRRSISVAKASTIDFFDFDFADTDYFNKGAFCFVDLPKGEYKLTIKAYGYSPYTISQSVVPGKFVNIQPFLLTPLRSAADKLGN